MTPVLKQSPLCSRRDGREIYFTVRADDGKRRVVVPQGLLDERCGADAGETPRKAWVKENMANILVCVTGRPKVPFDRVLVEDIA